MTKMCVGEAAARLCGAPSLFLGWRRPEELWNCTPMELAAALSFAEQAADDLDAEAIDALRKRFS
jgi:hypothetical protein